MSFPPLRAEDKGILDEKGNLVEEDDVVLENILAVSWRLAIRGWQVAACK